jgi:hypothetical protein
MTVFDFLKLRNDNFRLLTLVLSGVRAVDDVSVKLTKAEYSIGAQKTPENIQC